MTFNEEVKKELMELRKVGVNVPDGAFTMVEDKSVMDDYQDGCMSVSECADLLIALAL